MSTPAPSLNQLVLGTDLIYVPRLQTAYARYGRGFLSKLLTEAELAHCFSAANKPLPIIRRAAGKIAVKEAVSKALGTGIQGLGWAQGVPWHSIEVVAQNQQAPRLLLHGKAQQAAQNLGLREWRISLSHDGDYATATAIGF